MVTPSAPIDYTAPSAPPENPLLALICESLAIDNALRLKPRAMCWILDQPPADREFALQDIGLVFLLLLEIVNCRPHDAARLMGWRKRKGIRSLVNDASKAAHGLRLARKRIDSGEGSLVDLQLVARYTAAVGALEATYGGSQNMYSRVSMEHPL